MTDKSQALIDELVAACIAFGRQVEPDWQTRIEKAQRELREYIDELEAHIAALEEAYARKLKSGTTFPIFQNRRR